MLGAWSGGGDLLINETLPGFSSSALYKSEWDAMGKLQTNRRGVRHLFLPVQAFSAVPLSQIAQSGTGKIKISGQTVFGGVAREAMMK